MKDWKPYQVVLAVLGGLALAAFVNLTGFLYFVLIKELFNSVQITFN
jgi:hypothetical protein